MPRFIIIIIIIIINIFFFENLCKIRTKLHPGTSGM